MRRSKKIFAAFAIVFFLTLVYIVYDISSRTTFPGAKPEKETSAEPSTDTTAQRSGEADSQP